MEATHGRRRLLRTRHLVLLGLVLVGVWVGLEVYRALTAVPGRAIDYGQLAAELAERYQPPGAGPETPNAWDLLPEAAAILDPLEARYRGVVLPEEGSKAALLDYTSLYDDSATDEDYEPWGVDLVRRKALMAIQEFEAAGGPDVLARIARTPRAVRPSQSAHLIEWLLPELRRLRNLARLSAARMRVAHDRGDGAARAVAFEQMLALARIAAHQTFVIERLVGVAVLSLACQELRHELIERAPDAVAARELLAAMDRQLPLPPIALALEGGRLVLLDTIQWTHTDDGRGSGRLMPSQTGSLASLASGPGYPAVPSAPNLPIVNVAGLLFASKAAVQREANRYYDRVVDAVTRRPEGWRQEVADAASDVRSLSFRYVTLKVLLSDLEKIIRAELAGQMQVDGTRLMLAVELFAAERGIYPRSLDELAPAYLDAVPMDVFTDQPFRYRPLAPGEDEHGRPYLLYSVGADGEDNGGAIAPKHVAVSLDPSAVQGFDFVLNTPRPGPRRD